jgi:hypothetical protein
MWAEQPLTSGDEALICEAVGIFNAGLLAAPATRGCSRADHLGCVRGFHRGMRPSTLGGGAKKGDAQAEPPGGVSAEPADHGLGRFRGGLSSKVHLVPRSLIPGMSS